MPKPAPTRKPSLRYAANLLERHRWLEAVIERAAAPGEQFAVAFVLAGMVNSKTAEAWPSLDAIGKKAGCSRRTVQRTLNSLRAAGAVECTRRGPAQTWVFRLVRPKLWAPPEAHLDTPDVARRGATGGASYTPHVAHRTQEVNTRTRTQEKDRGSGEVVGGSVVPLFRQRDNGSASTEEDG